MVRYTTDMKPTRFLILAALTLATVTALSGDSSASNHRQRFTLSSHEIGIITGKDSMVNVKSLFRLDTETGETWMLSYEGSAQWLKIPEAKPTKPAAQ
jgi:hypothetical protein